MKTIDSNLLCPSCHEALKPQVLVCEGCDIKLEGHFHLNEFATLAPDDLHFLRIFVHSEGRVRDMESALGLSYPTIRTKLTALKNKLTLSAEEAAQMSEPKAQASASIPEIPAPTPAPVGVAESACDSLSSFLRTTLKGTFAGAFNCDMRKNSVHMSKLESPQGGEFTFESNSINVSSVTDIHIQRGEFSRNSVNACKLHDVNIKAGLLRECAFHGSSIQDLNLLESEIKKVEIHGSKIQDVRLSHESRMEALKFMGSVLKDFKLIEKSEWQRGIASGFQMTDAQIQKSRISDTNFEGAQLNDIKIIDSEIKGWVGRAVRFQDLQILKSHFTNVQFSGKDTWKHQGFKDVRFENCRLEKWLFSECRFQDVIFRNIDLKNINIHGLELQDVVVDGNEALKKLLS